MLFPSLFVLHDVDLVIVIVIVIVGLVDLVDEKDTAVCHGL